MFKTFVGTCSNVRFAHSGLVGLDFWGRLALISCNGNRYILVVVDCYTGLVWLFPTLVGSLDAVKGYIEWIMDASSIEHVGVLMICHLSGRGASANAEGFFIAVPHIRPDKERYDDRHLSLFTLPRRSRWVARVDHCNRFRI